MISVFIATSGRPEMFKNMLQSLKETTMGHDVEIVAVIDADSAAYIHAVGFGVDKVDYSHERRGALWAWNRGLQLSSGDILLAAGDDQIFHDNWIQYALEGHQGRLGGSGVLGMNDCAYKPPQTATMFLFDRAFCLEHMGGIFAPPCYKYYCIDSEWNEKSKMLGKFHWQENSKVEHLHSAHLKRPVDATDALKEDKWMAIDNATFEDRKHRAFPIEWDALI